MNADGTVPVTEIWRNFDNTMDPINISLVGRLWYQIWVKMQLREAFENGTLTRTFLQIWKQLTYLKLQRILKLT